MSKKKELKQDELEKVNGGEETKSPQALFKPKYVAAPNGGGAVYSDGGIELKPETDQYQPDLVKPNNIDQGGVPETEINGAFGLGK